MSRAKDEQRTMVYIAPRKEGSNWSALNKQYVAELEAGGLMTPAGRAMIDRAKEDGSWTALDDVENLVVPPDLQAAFDLFPNAKKPETRAKRIAETARLAAEKKAGQPVAVTDW